MFAGYRAASGRLLIVTHKAFHLIPSSSYTYKAIASASLPAIKFSSSFPLSSSSSFSEPSRTHLWRSVPLRFVSPRLHSFAFSSPYQPLKLSCWHSQFVRPTGSMDLKEVLDILEQLAPLSLAESWDNVGLLVEPSKPRQIRTILLTNDLTTSVMDEAEAMKCDLIISYHPPLFRPIKRLVQKDWKQRLAVRAVESGIAVYSPHTSWDSVKGGVNDWLLGGMGSGCVSVLSQALCSTPQRHRLDFKVKNQDELSNIMAQLRETDSSGTLQHTMLSPEEGVYLVNVTCPSSALTSTVQILLGHATVSQSLNIVQLQQPPLLGCGQGRLSILDEPISVAESVQRMKLHLGLSHLRLALGNQQTLESTVKTVAVCAGSGASVLQGVKADLYITGEMSHHEVLDAVAKGTSVILSDHSNSERGFLTVFKERLAVRLPESVTVAISQRDRDPLEVV
ncbi:NIF3-like protein 1 [Chanos chanos]|uniref:NIF3-like protein 1 n=1 Tax=Chanos chanos TaxID=29144 RepID=A0A6J2VDF7_CHACN|nr:NIF3-like protein 1 [Chanos chanos]